MFDYPLEIVNKIKVNDNTLKINEDLILLLNNDVKIGELEYFNKPIETFQDLNHLNLGYGFNNQQIDKIEDLDIKAVNLENITHLRFYNGFNQPIELLDLKNVTHLNFGTQFNQPIDNLDLKNVTHLDFGYEFNQPIEYLNLKNIKFFKLKKTFFYI